MRIRNMLFLLVCMALAACGGADRREYPLKGQILAIGPDPREASIKHEEIKGFMAAMTMTYKVRDAKEYAELVPGDLISATLVVVSNDAYLTGVKRTGNAPLEKPASAPAPTASSGFELIRPGQPVPDGDFVDQDGRTTTLATFRGSRVVVTFIYTMCPLPTFCPLMDRHFATIQKGLKEKGQRDVHLVSVSVDPITDTPAVLKQHATKLGADPRLWTFLTGDRDALDQWASRFGMSVSRAMNDSRDITHNLRTAIIDGNGTLVKTYTGNEWTPDQVLNDLGTHAAGG
jgi:protein SCO1/2